MNVNYTHDQIQVAHKEKWKPLQVFHDTSQIICNVQLLYLNGMFAYAELTNSRHSVGVNSTDEDIVLFLGFNRARFLNIITPRLTTGITCVTPSPLSITVPVKTRSPTDLDVHEAASARTACNNKEIMQTAAAPSLSAAFHSPAITRNFLPVFQDEEQRTSFFRSKLDHNNPAVEDPDLQAQS